MMQMVANTTTPCTVGRSNPNVLFTARRPSPGSPKIVSVKIAPPRRNPAWSPVMVRIGGSAFCSTWRPSTRASLNPFARAVRTWSCPRTSSMLPRTSRAMMAPGAAAVASAGSARWARRSSVGWTASYENIPDDGSQRSRREKKTTSRSPNQ